ncbi:MAG: TolC family protein [Sulfurovaceae bacterium]|nr:TolC family protein [Sulfurovaceae bacterium]
MKIGVQMAFLSLSILSANDYHTLLNKALNRSVALQISQTKQQQISLNGEIAVRYENPKVELEIANFINVSSNGMEMINEVGVRTGVSQKLLLPVVKKDMNALSIRKISVANQNHNILKSEFIYKFTMSYLDYKHTLHRQTLLTDLVMFSDEALENIMLRYQHGAIAKSKYLESKQQHTQMLNSIYTLKREIVQKRSDFLIFANLDSRTVIDTTYSIRLEEGKKEHQLIKLKEQEEALSHAKLKLLSHSIQTVELFSEIEKEPNEDIFHVGISISIPIFNDKEQEKQLAKIELTNHKLERNNQKRILKTTLNQLYDRQKQIELMRENHTTILTQEDELLGMYQQSYNLAKVNLSKFQNSRQKMIKIKEQIALLDADYEKNILKINYLRGVYSE